MGVLGDRMKQAYGEFCSRHTESVQLYKDLHKSDRKVQLFAKVIFPFTPVYLLCCSTCVYYFFFESDVRITGTALRKIVIYFSEMFSE